MLNRLGLKRDRAIVRRDLKWGLAVCAGFAFLFSVIVAVQATVKGPGFEERLGFPVGLLILGYFLLGGIVGILLGLLRPLARTRVGAAVLGVLMTAPVFVLMGTFFAYFDPTMDRPDSIAEALRDILILTVAMSCILGAPTALYYRRSIWPDE
ncbi:MAG: hypothetical protein RRA92_08060 [Gemmatimonadota bacterium]|nr:hypothetical protein [Gemmatimonadota bacterium]